MIAPKDSIEPQSTDLILPNSRRVFAQGEIHPEVRVPMREIELSPTRNANGTTEPNDPVRVYDTSGPWGDPDFAGNVEQGLPEVRREWILNRGDVAEYQGRAVLPKDNGYLSEVHAERSNDALFPAPRRQPLRASAGHPVTQLWYARQGIITPEMEYIAIRDNLGME